MRTQAEKGKIFRALHERNSAFIIPNPWDIGSAKLLQHMGFEALASTSAGYAFSIGKRDYKVGRDKMMTHVAELAAATDLPVSADLENGYGDEPKTVAETIRLAAKAGLAGCSIEDSTQRANDPIYEFKLAVERVRAAVEAARSFPFTFTLTARCENFLVGKPDLKDTIKRLQAYQEAGADVLYAPLIKTREEISAVVSSLEKPVNVLVGFPGMSFSLAELSEMGVRRVSIGSALSRAAYGAVLRAAGEMKSKGTFNFNNEAATSKEINVFLDV